MEQAIAVVQSFSRLGAHYPRTTALQPRRTSSRTLTVRLTNKAQSRSRAMERDFDFSVGRARGKQTTPEKDVMPEIVVESRDLP
jgi:hypothetical protein